VSTSAPSVLDVHVAERVDPPVLRGAGHPRVRVAEHLQPVHSQYAGRGLQLAAAPVDEPFAVGQQPLRHLPQRAVGGSHQYHPMSGIRGQAHDTTGGEDLIVGVGVEAHENALGGH
jgi:hypothetical protein